MSKGVFQNGQFKRQRDPKKRSEDMDVRSVNLRTGETTSSKGLQQNQGAIKNTVTTKQQNSVSTRTRQMMEEAFNKKRKK